MNEYRVRIQVIKVYDIWVKARSRSDAISEAEGWQSTEIQENGSLVDVSTDYAEVWEGPEDEDQEPEPIYRVEYDTSYTGGDYDKVGSFVDVQPDPGEPVERTFERVTGLSRVHIISYDVKWEDPEDEDQP